MTIKNMQISKWSTKGVVSRLSSWQSLFFTLPVSVFIGIIIAYSSYIPMWDSREYLTTCVLPAVSAHFSLLAFNCANHGSIVFGLLYSVLQYISYGNVFFFHLTSLILMCIAFGFLYSTFKRIFGNTFWAGIAMALVCWNPAIIANTLNPTPDLLVLAFSMMCLWGFLTRRIFIASFFGMALLFTKESGIIFYVLCSFLYLTLHLQYNRNKMIFIYRSSLILCWPFILYAAFLWYKTTEVGASLLYQNASFKFLIGRLFFINWHDRYFYADLSGIFLLNFQWVVVVGILLGAAFFIRKLYLRVSGNAVSSVITLQIIFITLLVIYLSYILSRFPHFLNVRYFLLIFPLTSLLFIYALQCFHARKTWILGVVFAIILLISCFRTIDPISRDFYGTFYFGNHPMLKMVSVSHECCGYGRDQLVYNLEHTQIQTLLSQFSRQVQLTNKDVMLTNPLSDRYIYANIDDATYEMTLHKKDSHSLLYIDDPEFLYVVLKAVPVGRIFFPEFPNASNEIFRAAALNRFKPLATISLENQGYRFNVVQLR